MVASILWSLLLGCSPAPDAAPDAKPVPQSASQRSLIGPQGTPDHVVDCNGGGDFVTISEAIAAAESHQWISVEPCTYHELLDYGGKAVWISSTGGAAVTEIDGDDQGPIVNLANGEGDGAALVGFTLRDGDEYAVKADFAAIRLQDIDIRDMTGDFGVWGKSADLELVNVSIDATVEANDWSIWMDKGALQVKDSDVVCQDGGAMFVGHGSYFIDTTTMSCATDPAWENEHAVGRMQRSVVIGDMVVEAEFDHFDDNVRVLNTVVRGDIDVHHGTFTFRNSLIVDGQATFVDTGDPIEWSSSIAVGGGCVLAGNGDVEVTASDFWGNSSSCQGPDVVGSNGNVAVDPLFVDPLLFDMHLQAASPLIDAGDPDNDYDDLDGSTNDMGIYGGRLTADGGW